MGRPLIAPHGAQRGAKLDPRCHGSEPVHREITLNRAATIVYRPALVPRLCTGHEDRAR